MIPLQGQLRWLPRDHPPSFPRAINLRAQHMVPGLVKMAQLEKKRKKKICEGDDAEGLGGRGVSQPECRSSWEKRLCSSSSSRACG